MQDSEMRDKLEKIIEAYEELAGQDGRPGRACRSEGIQQAWPRNTPTRASWWRRPREYLQACGRPRRGQGDARRPRYEGVRPGGDRRASRRSFRSLEEDIKFMLIPVRSGRREGHHRGDPRGAGGDEAAIFAGDLYKMYERFASRRRDGRSRPWTSSPSEAGGYKEIQFKVKGDKVYSVMKFESRRAPRAARAQDRVPGTHPHLHGHRGRAARSRRGGGGDQRERPAHRRVPRRRPGRPVRQHHRLRRAHHAPAHGSGGAVAGPEVPAAEQDRRHGRAARAPLREDARRAAGGRRCRAPRPRSARATAPRRSAPTTARRTA